MSKDARWEGGEKHSKKCRFSLFDFLASWRTGEDICQLSYLKKDLTERSRDTHDQVNFPPPQNQPDNWSFCAQWENLWLCNVSSGTVNNQHFCCWRVSNKNIWNKLSVLWNTGSCGHLSGEAINTGLMSIVAVVFCCGPWSCFLYFQWLWDILAEPTG